MQFASDLIEARLLRRYKRFLADVELPSGAVITVHCPNTGSMRRCQQDNAQVWLSDSGNPNRKYRHTWELVEVDNRYLACINTNLANKLVKEALDKGRIETLAGYRQAVAEVKYGTNSRIDWLLSNPADNNRPTCCYLEVKNVTLLEKDGKGYFPDAVTDRGLKHLQELSAMVSLGHRAVLLFCVSHTGIDQVLAARHIDPAYAIGLQNAVASGVEVIAYKAQISTDNIRLSHRIDYVHTDQD